MTWNVGDEIIVQEKNFGRGPGRVAPYVVTRVARKYFYAKGAGDNSWCEVAFEIDSGREKNNGSNYHSYAYKPEQWEAKQRRDALNERLDAHNVQFAYHSDFGHDGYRLTDTAIEAILAILDAEKLRIESER